MNDIEKLDRIDANSHIPMYIQLYAILRRWIEEGRYTVGDQLPSEKELTEKFNISRITATAGIQEVVQSGLAFRVQGKGTFVAPPKIRGLSSFGSFTTDILERGMKPGSRLVSFEKLIPDEEVRQRLDILPREICYCLERVRLANEEPVAFESAYLPEKYFPGLENEDFEQNSLYEVLERRYGRSLAWSEGIFEAAAANEKIAALMEIQVGDPVLWIRRVTMDKNFVPLEWVHSAYRADRFSFSTGRQPIDNH